MYIYNIKYIHIYIISNIYIYIFIHTYYLETLGQKVPTLHRVFFFHASMVDAFPLSSVSCTKARSRGIWLKGAVQLRVLSNGVRRGCETLEVCQCQGWIEKLKHSANIVFLKLQRVHNFWEGNDSILSLLPGLRTWKDFMDWRNRRVSIAQRSVSVHCPQFKCISVSQ